MKLLNNVQRNPVWLKTFIVLFCLFLYLLGISIKSNASLSTTLKTFVNCFYSPHNNLIFNHEINGFNVNLSLLFLIIFSILVLKLTNKLLSYDKINKDSLALQDNFLVIIIFLILLSLIQTFNYSRYALDQNKTLQNKTSEEIKTLIFGSIYPFAKHAKKILPGRHKGRLVSDIDLFSLDGVHEHLALAYHLFPITIQPNLRQIQITHHYVMEQPHPSDYDVLVVYKKNVSKKVLEGRFNILEPFDSNSFLAIRKK